MGKIEFIALMALLMALNALAIDIMLPGLQEIGASLGVENENHRQYVISAYLIGFAFAQLLYGPVSDRFGRRILGDGPYAELIRARFRRAVDRLGMGERRMALRTDLFAPPPAPGNQLSLL